jgi:nucleotide-binding universal stress UspA family protein
MWKILLVPHDFSACAAAALAMAAKLARTHGAELVLLHVSDLPPNVPGNAHEEVMRGASERLEALAAPLRNAGLSVATRARIGDPCREILGVARDDEASALVMGTHGREGLARAFLGSVTESVVRRSPVPVVIVRVPDAEAVPTAEEQAAEDELVG